MAARRKKRRTPPRGDAPTKKVSSPRPPREGYRGSRGLRTDERRIRVRELWGRKQRVVAEILLEEGFEVTVGRRPHTPDGIEKWELRRVEAMRRNVSADRAWWEEKWRQRAKIPKGGEDVAVERESYIASLESDLDQIADDLETIATKATAKAILHGERRQTRALIAKARGVEQIAEVPTNEKPKVPVAVFIGTRNVSSEMKARLAAQGVEIE